MKVISDRLDSNGRHLSQNLSKDEWHTFIPEAHEGYISWKEYEENQRCLRKNAQACGADRRKSPPREGPALLQGLVVCGVCGRRMTVRYYTRSNRLQPVYLCQVEGIRDGEPICQSIPGDKIDQAIGALVLQSMTPLSLEIALTVQKELSNRIEEANKLRLKQVERARYEAGLAQRRYMQVDPGNRLVADALEADWNQKLRELEETQDEYQRHCEADKKLLDEKEHSQIMALITDFPKLWNDPYTSTRERKRIIRLLLEDATLTKKQGIIVRVRFKGGAATSFSLPSPKPAWEMRQTSPEVIAEIDRLIDHYMDKQIADKLNENGFISGESKQFHAKMITRLRRDYKLKSRYQRLRESGKLTADEMAKLLEVSSQTIKIWRRNGLLLGYPCNDKNECLFEPPGPDAPVKTQGSKFSKRGRFPIPALQKKGRVLSHERGAV